MRPTPGWGPSSRRYRTGRNTRWSTSAESCHLRNNATLRSRRRRWPLSGQSWSSGTTSSAVSSPSSLTMPLYSGWPGRRTPTRGWRVASWRSRISTSLCDTGRGRPTPTQMDSPGCGQLSQVCQDSFPSQPRSPRSPADHWQELSVVPSNHCWWYSPV